MSSTRFVRRDARGVAAAALALLLIPPVACVASERGAPDPVAYYELLRESQRLQGNGDHAGAAAACERLTALYDRDGQVWLDLAESRVELRKLDEAVPAYRNAYRLGTWSRSRVALEIARCFAGTGKPDSALAWIERSLADGLEDRAGLREDAALAALRSDPRFGRLAGELPDRSYTREEGWSHDLDFLVSEVKRYHYVYRWKPLPPAFETGVRQLRSRIPSLSDEGVFAAMQKLVALLGDGHSTLYPVGDRIQIRPAPVVIHQFADGVFVIDAPDSASRWRGARVEMIGAHPVDEVLRRLEPYVSRDNDNGPRVVGPYLARVPVLLHELGIVPDVARLPLVAVTHDGRRIEGSFTPPPPGDHPHLPKLGPPRFAGAPEAPLYLRRVQDPYWFEPLPGDSVVYFQFNQVINAPGETVRQFAVRLRRHLDEHPVRVLIVDVRHNNGGNGDLLTSLIRTLVHFETTRPGSRMFVITGPKTFSACQVFIAQLDRLTNAVFVGETSGSRPTFAGEDTGLRLPWSGVRGSISSRLHQSSSQEERTWIPPEIPVAATGADWRAGRDAAMEVVLRVVRGDRNAQGRRSSR